MTIYFNLSDFHLILTISSNIKVSEIIALHYKTIMYKINDKGTKYNVSTKENAKKKEKKHQKKTQLQNHHSHKH